MQNLSSFQTPFKFSKSINWLWRYNISRKRPIKHRRIFYYKIFNKRRGS